MSDFIGSKYCDTQGCRVKIKEGERLCTRCKIKTLRKENARLREALETTIKHQKTIGGTLAEQGVIYRVAQQALKDREE